MRGYRSLRPEGVVRRLTNVSHLDSHLRSYGRVGKPAMQLWLNRLVLSIPSAYLAIAEAAGAS